MKYDRSINQNQIHDRECADDGIIDLSVGDPQDPPPPQFYAAHRRRVVDGRISHYPDPVGLLELRAAVSRQYQDIWGMSLDPESDICVVNGARGALQVALIAAERFGRPCGYVDPAYFGLPTAIRSAMMAPVPLRLEEVTSADVDRVLKRLSGGLLVIVSPHNPTGRILTVAELERIKHAARESDVKVVSDFVYKHLFSQTRPASFLELDATAIEVSSFSKTFRVCGARCGYVAGKGEWIRKFRKIITDTQNGVDPLTQMIMSDLLNDMSGVHEFRDSIVRRRDLLSRFLLRCGFEIQQYDNHGTNFVWAKNPLKAGSSSEIAARLEKANVRVLPGSALGSNGEGFTRFSLNYGEAVLERAGSRITAVMRPSRERYRHSSKRDRFARPALMDVPGNAAQTG